jgi:hypothetical protein
VVVDYECAVLCVVLAYFEWLLAVVEDWALVAMFVLDGLVGVLDFDLVLVGVLDFDLVLAVGEYRYE